MVSLIPDVEGFCWGIAYKIPEERVQQTIEYLDMRERAGYEVILKIFFNM